MDQMLRTAEQLHTQFQSVSTASARTLGAAGEMQKLSSDGRDLSKDEVKASDSSLLYMTVCDLTGNPKVDGSAEKFNVKLTVRDARNVVCGWVDTESATEP
jgi:hypothetical protein